MAQSIGGTNLAISSETNAKPCLKVEVAWGKKWSDTISGGDWIDETANVVLPLTVNRSLADPDSGFTMVGQGLSAQATVTLYNNSERYSAFNSSSPIYTNIRDGQIRNTPIRIEMGYYDGATPELLREFTGLISSMPSASIAGGTVTFNCLGRDEAIRTIEGKTVVYEDIALTDWIEVLAAIAGLSASDWNLDIDDSVLQWMWLDDEQVWMKLQEAAEAAGGMIYFDHSGILRFEGMQHWVDGSDHTASVYTFTTAKITDLSQGYSYEDGYSSVLVEYIRRDEGYTDVVWNSEEPIHVGPGETVKQTARLDYPCSEVGDAVEETDYACVTGGGIPKMGNITITGSVYAAQVELEIVNDEATHGVYVHNLQLRGRPLLGGPKSEVKKITSAGYITDTREFSIMGNQCIQSLAQATKLAEYYRDRFERVPCIWTLPPAPAKPWLELGDRITIVVSDHGLNNDAYIVGVTYEISTDHAFTMSLECLEADYLYPVSTYYNWGDNLEEFWAQPSIDSDNIYLDNANMQKVAITHTPGSTFTCRAIALYLYRVGNPGGRVRPVIYSDNTGEPGSPITGGYGRWIDTEDIDTATTALPGQWYGFFIPDEPEWTATPYWVVLEPDSDYTYAVGDKVVWKCDAVGIPGSYGPSLYNGATWSANPNYDMPWMGYSLPLFY